MRPTRTISAAVLLAALALLAAACGGGDEGGSGGESAGRDTEAAASECPVDALETATGPVEVTLWHAYVGLTARTLQSLADQYNASQSKVRINVQAQGNYEEMLTKYKDALGDPATLPDVVLPEDTTTQFMIDSGSVIPAASCIAADPSAAAIYDGILPAVTAAYTVDGTLWPGAFSVSTPVLYFNEEHFTAAGLDPAKPPATLAEVRSTAEAIKNAGVPGVEQPLVVKVDSWYLEHWLTGVDQPIVNEDNGRAALATASEFANQRTTELVTWMKDMVDAGLMKAVPNSAVIDNYLALATGTSSMGFETSTAITTVNGVIEGTLNAEDLGLGADGPDLSGFQIPDLQIGVGLMPGPTGAGKGQIGGSAWYIVKATDPAVIAGSWDFLKWFNQPANQVTWTQEGSYLPVSNAAAQDPTLQQDWNTTRKGGWLQTAYEGIAGLDPNFPGPVIGPYNEFRTEVRGALERVTLGGEPVQPNIDTANANFASALTSYAQQVGG